MQVDTVLFVGPGDDTHNAQFDEATHTWKINGRCARVVISSSARLPAHWAPADGLEPYLGVAVHGTPNYFLLSGGDKAAQKAYFAKCLDYLGRAECTRIEVRLRTQRDFNRRSIRRTLRLGHNWRRAARRIPSAFEFSSIGGEREADDAVHDGTATVRIGDQSFHTRVRLTGSIDPIDGHYHWQGTIFEINVDVKLPQDVTVTVQDRAAPARLTERTPWSAYSVVGIGAPPFELDEVEVVVPIL